MKHLTETQVETLHSQAFEIRKLCLEFITSSGWGHLGGSFSEAELLACLYGAALRIDPKRPQAPERDRLIFSKAHASPGLYAILAIHEFFPREKLFDYCRIGGLDGHTQRGQVPGIEFSGGSLGTGLSYAAGVALGLRLRDQFQPRVYCLLGDGECNEGQVWEAAMAAAHYRLDNLVAIVDYNKVMAKGKTSDAMNVDPLHEKFASFGWTVLEIDGHDVREICQALHRTLYLEMNGRPVAILAHTAKGRGVPECEFNYHWHTHAPSVEQAGAFLAALNKEYAKVVSPSPPSTALSRRAEKFRPLPPPPPSPRRAKRVRREAWRGERATKQWEFCRPLVAPKDGGLQAVIEEELQSRPSLPSTPLTRRAKWVRREVWRGERATKQ